MSNAICNQSQPRWLSRNSNAIKLGQTFRHKIWHNVSLVSPKRKEKIKEKNCLANQLNCPCHKNVQPKGTLGSKTKAPILLYTSRSKHCDKGLASQPSSEWNFITHHTRSGCSNRGFATPGETATNQPSKQPVAMSLPHDIARFAHSSRLQFSAIKEDSSAQDQQCPAKRL